MAKTREICVLNRIYCQFSDLLEIFLSKAYHPFTYSFIHLCFQQIHFEAPSCASLGVLLALFLHLCWLRENDAVKLTLKPTHLNAKSAVLLTSSARWHL